MDHRLTRSSMSIGLESGINGMVRGTKSQSRIELYSIQSWTKAMKQRKHKFIPHNYLTLEERWSEASTFIKQGWYTCIKDINFKFVKLFLRLNPLSSFLCFLMAAVFVLPL